MKRRAFLAGAAALAASPALPVGPVEAGEWWTPELLSAGFPEASVTFFANRVFWVNTAGAMMQFDCTENPEKWSGLTVKT
jgi:hypothetical protein